MSNNNTLLDPLKKAKGKLQDITNATALLRSDNYQFLRFAPPGHYYSPIPDIQEVRESAATIFNRDVTHIPGVDINEQGQLDLVKEFIPFYKAIPFPHEKEEEYRYYFDNPYFSYGDGVILYSMMRYFTPKRIIEVGSGFSSAQMLDMNQKYSDGQIDIDFIEPYPERLNSLLTEADKQVCTIIEKPVQQVEPEFFRKLEKNDILFIDSSHVVKINSDLSYLLNEVLPALKTGVIIHFHDIMWPFEYPLKWIKNGRAWNEAYFLRAFLQYNTAFEILCFNSYLDLHHTRYIKMNMPLQLRKPTSKITYGNSSLWIRKKPHV